MNPSPKAAPISPMPLARISGVVDVGDERLRRRECSRRRCRPGSAPGTASAATWRGRRTGMTAADPSNPMRITGRRPMRSDSRPQNGANRNCASENDVDSRPTDQRGRAEVLGVERQQGDDDPEPEQVDEDREEDDDERRHGGSALQAAHGVREAAPDGDAAEVRCPRCSAAR